MSESTRLRCAVCGRVIDVPEGSIPADLGLVGFAEQHPGMGSLFACEGAHAATLEAQGEIRASKSLDA